MPYGLIAWVDASAQQVGVRRENRTYHARLAEVVPAARQVGARVHFDIARRDGVESAVDVRLRSHRGNGRGGDLVGARSAVSGASEPATSRHPEYSRNLPLHPLQVVAAWGRHLAGGELDEALRLYSPDVVIHLDGTSLVAVRLIRSHLMEIPPYASAVSPSVRGGGERVTARWDLPQGEFEVASRVVHHLIAEQWMNQTLPAGAVEVGAGAEALVVTTRGEVDADLVDYARQRIGRVTERLVEPLLASYVKLELSPDPARERPALASVQLDLNGSFVGAHVASEEMRLAVDLLQRRLADQLEHRQRRFEALHRSTPARPDPGEWQHGDLPSDRPAFFDRPADERELVRHKAFLPEGQTLEEAIFDMEQLDYGFYLFLDIDTGSDSLVEKRAEGAYRLRRLRPGPPPGSGVYRVEPDDRPVPHLAVAEAMEQLSSGGMVFVFFADDATGRGSVLYLRYDGHYGLITLAE